MTDLLSIIPRFPISTFSHIIPSLERNRVTTVDLLTLEPTDIARKAQIPGPDAKKLCTLVLRLLQQDLGVLKEDDASGQTATAGDGEAAADALQPKGNVSEQDHPWELISLGDGLLDGVLGGGLPVGYISEFVGESGAGKTQFLLTLALRVQLPRSLGGLGRSALYISTEASISTSRLAQIIKTWRSDSANGPEYPKDAPTLDRVHSIQCPDLESQNHILTYQLPIAIERFDVGLVIIDSIAANFRTGDTTLQNPGVADPVADLPTSDPRRRAAILGQRSQDLFRLGHHLQKVATERRVAIVVANQVADWIAQEGGSIAGGARVIDNGTTTKSYHMGTLSHVPLSQQIQSRNPAIAPPTELRKSFLESVDNVSLASSSPMTASQVQRLASPSPMPPPTASSQQAKQTSRTFLQEPYHGPSIGSQEPKLETPFPADLGTSDPTRTDRKRPCQGHSRSDLPAGGISPAALSVHPSRVMSLDHQMRWFSGWGEPGSTDGIPSTNLKTPALGLTWSNLISARFVIKKQDAANAEGRLTVRRRLQCVFAPWAKSGWETAVEFEIWDGGLRAKA